VGQVAELGDEIEVGSQDLGVVRGEGEEPGEGVVEEEGVKVGLDEVAAGGTDYF